MRLSDYQVNGEKKAHCWRGWRAFFSLCIFWGAVWGNCEWLRNCAVCPKAPVSFAVTQRSMKKMDHFLRSLLFESHAQRLCEECSVATRVPRQEGTLQQAQISFGPTYVATLGTWNSLRMGIANKMTCGNVHWDLGSHLSLHIALPYHCSLEKSPLAAQNNPSFRWCFCLHLALLTWLHFS